MWVLSLPTPHPTLDEALEARDEDNVSFINGKQHLKGFIYDHLCELWIGKR